MQYHIILNCNYDGIWLYYTFVPPTYYVWADLAESPIHSALHPTSPANDVCQAYANHRLIASHTK